MKNIHIIQALHYSAVTESLHSSIHAAIHYQQAQSAGFSFHCSDMFLHFQLCIALSLHQSIFNVIHHLRFRSYTRHYYISEQHCSCYFYEVSILIVLSPIPYLSQLQPLQYDFIVEREWK